MSKYTVKELARGIKLTVDHMFDLPSHIATTLNSASNLIQQDQLEQGDAPFRMNFNVPVVDGHLVNILLSDPSGPPKYDFCIPFCLPPLQEFWSTSGVSSENSPRVVLDEVQLSFDQRAEGAAIADGLYNNGATGHEGKVDYDGSDAYALELSIVEKQMQVFQGVGSSAIPQREIFSAKLPSLAFSGRSFRLNPWVIDNLNRAVSQFNSYLIMLRVNSLDLKELVAPITRNSHALVSLNINLKFRHPLVHADVEAAHDHGIGKVQNIPSDHDGEPVISTAAFPIPLVLNVPAGNSDLQADTADGLQVNYKKVDGFFANRFRGGFTKDSDRPGFSHLDQDCGYSVIAVPMFGNLTSERSITADVVEVSKFPYIVAGLLGPVGDRRIVMLDYPFTVHHVVACVNYTRPNYGLMPTRPGFVTKIGVGIATGPRADDYNYQQVAYATFTPVTKVNFRIDQLKTRLNSIMNADVAEFEMFNIPLVVQRGFTGEGFTTQGRPFWCGKATSRLTTRRNVGIVGGGDFPPTTKGLEQMLEVRWTMEDPAGLEVAADEEVYVGYGGHWVLIFGKVGLMESDDIPV